MKVAAAVLALLPATALLAQQNPPRDTRAVAGPPAPTGTGAISGQAVGDADARPVRFAYVVLLGAGTGVVKVSSTDADGRFAFANLPADRYTVGVSKPPYLGTVAGARRPGRTGTPIAVANGQKVSDVVVRLPIGSVITGTISDERGRPARRIEVYLHQWRMQGSERTLVPVGGVTLTDDTGRFRFFGLMPGDYLVLANQIGAPAPARVLSTEEVDAVLKGTAMPMVATPPPVRYAPVYFPGTTRVTDAMAVSLGVGEERGNVDFRLETVPTARIDGTLTSADGQPVGGVALLMFRIVAPGSQLSTAASVRVTPDGRFSAPNVTPGSYVLMVTGTGPLAGQFARAAIEVTGADVSGVQLTMQPALSMNARLVFDGTTAAPALAGRRVPLRSLSTGGLPMGGPAVAATNQAGAFTVTNLVPGRYVLGGPLALGPTSDTMTWALQSVIVDGRDLTDLPIEIGESAPKDVVVSYTDRWQELTGRLQSQSGAPVSDHTIVVFPEDKAYWIFGTRRIVTARPGTDGRFSLSGRGPTTLPPGRYLLAAVTDISREEQFDPAFLAQLVPAGVPIAIGPGEKKVQDLAIR